MVQIQIQKQKNSYQQVTISGHANFATKGSDIVCSAISGIVFGGLNAFDRQCRDSVEMIVGAAKIVIKILVVNQINQIIAQTIICQLQTINEQYPKYIKIKEF